MIRTKRPKTGDLVETRFGKYFVNGVPAGLQNKPEWFLCQNKVNVFFARHLDEFTYPAAEMRSWFPKTQPTETQVSRALLWASDQFHDYGIKAGGGAIADKQYSSHLKITIADSNTGLDRDVVLLKKYSQVFSEVLISIDEVQLLEDLLEPPARRAANRKSLLLSLLREIIRWFKGVKSMADGKGDWSEKHIGQMMKQIAEDYSDKEILTALERLADYSTNFEARQLFGGTGEIYRRFLLDQIRSYNRQKAVCKEFGPASQAATVIKAAQEVVLQPAKKCVQPGLFGN
jgi:hypothetical protein